MQSNKPHSLAAPHSNIIDINTELQRNEAAELKDILGGKSTLPTNTASLIKTLHRAATHNAAVAEEREKTERVKTSLLLKRIDDRIVKLQQAQAKYLAEISTLRKKIQMYQAASKELEACLTCSICTEVALLPKVVGKCGHIVCQDCLSESDTVTLATTATTGLSARQQLLARRCPECREEIMGLGFPVHSLKNVTHALIQHDYVITPNQAALKYRLAKNGTVYKEKTPVEEYISALQSGCNSQAKLAEFSVSNLLTQITPEQWIEGVYVLFEAAVSRIFFQTYAVALHGIAFHEKAGSLTVLPNASQRMLAVRLIDEAKPQSDDKKTGHTMVKVNTEGKFTVTRTTPTPPPASTAPAAVATTAAAATPAAPANSRPARRP